MITRFSQPVAQAAHGALTLRFHMHAEELPAGAVPPALAWQVFDPETETFVQEGEHQPLPAWPAAEGSAGELRLESAQLPQGRLLLKISLLAADGWRYLHGDRYLRLLLHNEGAALHVEDLAVSSAAMESLPRLGRMVARAFQYPVRTLMRNHALIRTMVWRDILGRYRGSFGGVFWSVLNPLLLMATYFFVFGVVLRARFAGDPSQEGFALYFLAGMLPWLPFSEAVGRAPGVLLEHANFIKKLIFPVETLPINLVASGLFLQAIAVGIYLLGLAAFRGGLPLSALWIPLLLVPQVLLSAGLCWMLSALGLLFRDLAQMMGFVLTLWFFLTPICYPEDALPADVRPFMALNPFFTLVRAWRDVLLQGQAPDWGSFSVLLLSSLLVFLAGHGLFHKLRRSFADLL